MRVQHQLAALEGSLQTFMEKQQMMGGVGGGSTSTMDSGRRMGGGRGRESMTPLSGSARGMGEEGAQRKRRRTTMTGSGGEQQRTPSDLHNQHMGYSNGGASESPIYADANSAGGTSSYPSTTQFSPRDVDRTHHNHHHQHHHSAPSAAGDGNAALLVGNLVATAASSNGYGSSPKPVDGGTGAGAQLLHVPTTSNHALPEDEGVPPSGGGGERGAFHTRTNTIKPHDRFLLFKSSE